MKSILIFEDLFVLYKNCAKIPVFAKKWFPVYPSEKLAELAGFLIGDGHIQGSPRWRIDFTSKDFGALNYVNILFFDLFGIKGTSRKCTTNAYGTSNLGINCKPLARLLFLCGIPVGAKVEKDFSVPNWILFNKACFRAFIRAYFSCEASVGPDNRISLEHWKLMENTVSAQIFLSQIIFGLKEYFGICCAGPYLMSSQNKTKKGITRGVRLNIRRHNDLVAFTRLIGFVSLVKQSKAESLFSSNTFKPSLKQSF